MVAVWTQAQPAYSGRFVSFSGIQALPRPVQQPHPPIVIGGGTPEAFARAVRHGNGWYGFARDLDGTSEAIRGLEEAAKRHERPAALGPLEISITPRGKFDADLVKRFADLGVRRLIPAPMGASEADLLRFVEKAQPLVGA
jgi:alkanesulfonate monooxygenase SsuD/methylene tetrahydromethanopterin reductase-like flavin-dependent oxidoreductase (luciferase family)